MLPTRASENKLCPIGCYSSKQSVNTCTLTSEHTLFMNINWIPSQWLSTPNLLYPIDINFPVLWADITDAAIVDWITWIFYCACCSWNSSCVIFTHARSRFSHGIMAAQHVWNHQIIQYGQYVCVCVCARAIRHHNLLIIWWFVCVFMCACVNGISANKVLGGKRARTHQQSLTHTPCMQCGQAHWVN